MLALVATVVATTMARWSSLRAYVPSAVAVAALLAVLGLIGGVWLVVPAAAVAVLLAREGLRPLARAAAALGALVFVLALPSIVIARTFISGATGNELTEGNGVANLGHPLDTLQVFGIWPATDFRTRPHDETVAYVLIGVLIAAAVAGVLIAWRRRAWGVPLYLAAASGGLLLVFALERNGLGSPWLNAKAMAIASPAVAAAAAAGVAAVFETGRRVEAIVAAGAIFAGVAWSNTLAYSNVWLAPRSQLAELEQIGERYAGDGPTLMTEYQPNGVRHFLRGLDAEAASERRRRQVDLRRGGVLDPGSSADLDEFTQAAVFTYPTLVLRRSPVASRPPSVYDLVWKGQWYEVWQMRAGSPEVLEHASLGNALDPRGVPPCSEVRRLARAAQQAGGLVASVARREPIYVDLSRAVLSAPVER